MLNVKRTVQREIVLEKGREVHRVIEKEVMGTQEEVKVQISRKDEWWALRLVNLMVCLEVLLETGRAVSQRSSASGGLRLTTDKELCRGKSLRRDSWTDFWSSG